MARELADWLEAYMDYTKHSEPPKSYHMWVGISCISAALQRKVYMRWNMGRLHPNMFTVLVGPSGRCRKGTAMSFGQGLLRSIPSIRMLPQRITPEQLIRDMKEAFSEYTDGTTGAMEMHCSMTAMSGELAVFLGQSNVDFLALLTDLYDSADEWEYRTKHQGSDRVKGVCLNFIGGTAPDWIKGMIPEAALGGGFTSRIIWVVEWDKGKTVADPTPTRRMYELQELLTNDLERIHTLTGEMMREELARDFYEVWYEEQDKKPPIRGEKFGGYWARRATHLNKLAMVMSAARSDECVIRVEDYERALRILQATEETMADAFTGLGKARYTDTGERCLNYLIKVNRDVGKKEFLRQFFPDVNNYEFDVAMQTLTAMGAIKVVRAGGDDTIFRLVYKL